MTDTDLFGRVIALLEESGIPYMLTGSFAAAYHGHPRATQDIDFVIAPTPQQVRRFIHRLPTGKYYANETAALDALSHESQFNVIDLATGWKIDLIFRKSRPFSKAEFERRARAEVEGLALFIATVEDVVLAKLEWVKQGGSRRQIEDVASLLQVRGDGLDLAYVRRWVVELDVIEEWRQATRAAGWPEEN